MLDTLVEEHQGMHCLVLIAEAKLPLFELEGTWEEIAEVLAEIAAIIPPAELAKLPPDFTDQLDHYIYGTPKR
jgi:hypothetical protein